MVLIRKETGRGFAWNQVDARLASVCGAGLMLFIPLAAALILPLLAGTLRRTKRNTPPRNHHEPNGRTDTRFNAIFLACLLGGAVILHISQLSFEHVMMEYRYFAPVWPFATLLIIQMLGMRDLAYLGEARYVLACIGMLGLSVALFWPEEQAYRVPAPGVRVLIDNPARGILLPLVFQLDGATPIYAAEPDDLLAAPDRWLPPLIEHGGLYSHFPGASADPADYDAVLALIAAAAPISEPEAPYIWQADFHRSDERVYLIGPARSP